jgi:hypothetical protein
MALALATVGGAAQAIDEVEQNDLLNSAQRLSDASDPSLMRDGASIKGMIAPPKPFPDVDFYTFYARKDQKLTLHIQDTGSFNPVLTVVSPSSKVKAEKFRQMQGDEIRLQDLVLDETGMWAIVVTPFSVLIGNPAATDFGTLVTEDSTPFQPISGSYTLVLTPAAPSVLPIGIEIKPGSGERAPINPKAKGVIPVALLASVDFDPFSIDVSSLTFGRTGDERTLRRCAGGGQDIDGDGDLDRVCTFENQGTNFNAMSSMGVLKGSTTSGTQFKGEGYLKAVPAPGKM